MTDLLRTLRRSTMIAAADGAFGSILVAARGQIVRSPCWNTFTHAPHAVGYGINDGGLFAPGLRQERPRCRWNSASA